MDMKIDVVYEVQEREGCRVTELDTKTFGVVFKE